MAQGLQIWDAGGNIVMDTSSGTVKILGKYEFNSSPVTLTHPLLATEESFYIVFPPFSKGSTSELKVVFSGSNATIYNTNQFLYKTIYVGVY